MKRVTRPAPLAPAAACAGPVPWRHLVEWMREDGVVKTEFGLVRRLPEPLEQETCNALKME